MENSIKFSYLSCFLAASLSANISLKSRTYEQKIITRTIKRTIPKMVIFCSIFSRSYGLPSGRATCLVVVQPGGYWHLSDQPTDLAAMSRDAPFSRGANVCMSESWRTPCLPDNASSIRLAISTRSLGVKSLRMLFSA